MKIQSNNITIHVEDTGGAKRPAVLLIMGLGMQLISWPDSLVNTFVEAGYRVIRFDNRDVGLSSHFDHLGVPNIAFAALRNRMGLPFQPPYSLPDMCHDALGVLDALKIKQAHVVGVSMGGMIAQRVALTAPQRVLSLTSIMSSSGARGLPGPHTEIGLAMLRRPVGKGKQAMIDHTVKFLRMIGSPKYRDSEQVIRERVKRGVARAFHPVGTQRQTAAILADQERPHLLHKITAPTLILHGEDDPLVPLECGIDTAKRIPGAKLVTIPGMGHDLASSLIPVLCREIASHLAETGPHGKQ